jgi:hypothetical protein
VFVGLFDWRGGGRVGGVERVGTRDGRTRLRRTYFSAGPGLCVKMALRT